MALSARLFPGRRWAHRPVRDRGLHAVVLSALGCPGPLQRPPSLRDAGSPGLLVVRRRGRARAGVLEEYRRVLLSSAAARPLATERRPPRAPISVARTTRPDQEEV